MKRRKAGHKNFYLSVAKKPSITNPSLLIPYYMKFSRQVYFAILRKFYILNHFNFAFLSTRIYISRTMLFNMSLN